MAETPEVVVLTMQKRFFEALDEAKAKHTALMLKRKETDKAERSWQCALDNLQQMADWVDSECDHTEADDDAFAHYVTELRKEAQAAEDAE